MKATNKYNNSFDGGKNGSGTYQNIINHITPHEIYIEGFLGSGSILRRKKPAVINIGFDIDKKTFNDFIHSGAAYKILEKHKETVIQTTVKYNIPADNQICIDVQDTILFLENSRLFINMLVGMGLRIFIYLDPPYPMFTRKSQRKLYRYELTDKDHIRLLNAVDRLKCNVLLSSYKNELYDKHLLPYWNTHTFAATTHVGSVEECLYYNYPKPTELHEYTHLGDDFRERERIKGIVNRNIDKYKRMPEIERNYLINEILKQYAK